MSCRTGERLGPYLEGELPSHERRALETHLESCGECSQSLRELRVTIHLLRLVPEPTAPTELGRKVMERIATGESDRARARIWLLRAWEPRLAPALVTLAATALVVLLLRTVAPSGAAWTSGSLALGSPPGQAQLEGPIPPGSHPEEIRRHVQLRSAPLRPAATGARTRPAPFRPRPGHAGGLGVGGAAPSGLELLPPRPLLTRCQAFGSGADAEGEGPGFDCRPWLTGMLALGQLDPRRFLLELGALPDADRDAWLEELVGFAVRSGSASRVATGLRASAEPTAASLAERFELEARTASVE